MAIKKQNKSKTSTVKSKPVKRNVGRPTRYKKEYNEKAFKLSLLGAIDTDIADLFEVNPDTIYEWKKKHLEFSESIKRGKLIADANVAERLYERAIGYQYQETKVEVDDKGKTIKKTITTKTLAPDTTAQIFWLKNRQKENWRDSSSIDHTNNGKQFEEFSKDDIMKELKGLLLKSED